MKNFLKYLLVSLASVIAFSAPAVAALATTGSVQLRAEPGSYVGAYLDPAGETFVHGIDGVFYLDTNSTMGASVYYNGDDSWSFDFAAPLYDAATNTVAPQRLHVGRYDNARRFPFNSPTRPGLSVSGAGSGYNELSGWFDVLDVGYNDNNELTRLAVNFAEFGENRTQSGPALYGALRINSSFPFATPVPEVSTSLQLGLGVVALGAIVVRRRRGQS